MSTTSTAAAAKTKPLPPHQVVSREEWLAARKELLAKEKKHLRESDDLAAERRALPWVKIEKNYPFDTPAGKKSLAELFEGRSQLLIYHLMFAPDWDAACLGCSFVSDHFDGAVQHLANRDVTLVAVSRAPLAKFTPFKHRMGWGFKWYSSFGTDFNRDFHVSFTKDEMAAGTMFYNYKIQNYPMEEGHGLSAFYKDEAGNIYHTYSTYGRGAEALLGTYNILDLAPKGRDEQDQQPMPMAWVRHHDKYDSHYHAAEPALPANSFAATAADAGKPGNAVGHDCCHTT
ncbi:MAG TPA: thioredoxin family protein [Bryobacteraceae bacterium]|nr:thioredoxin family protein [Bryobacteraceae bacterium]